MLCPGHGERTIIGYDCTGTLEVLTLVSTAQCNDTERKFDCLTLFLVPPLGRRFSLPNHTQSADFPAEDGTTSESRT
jgi:hypothetical protein